MRIILLIICLAISLTLAALGYLTATQQMNLYFYILLSTLIGIALTFLSGHFIYKFLEKTSSK